MTKPTKTNTGATYKNIGEVSSINSSVGTSLPPEKTVSFFKKGSRLFKIRKYKPNDTKDASTPPDKATIGLLNFMFIYSPNETVEIHFSQTYTTAVFFDFCLIIIQPHSLN
ncbi:hypothetical protein, partial [uncultured Gilvimarinus sp.]|uniref:hypothetical protein n=1 Tax=uncultured Gilvimarinus sp. TaxID=1689143 RepID=UPI0030DAF27C